MILAALSRLLGKSPSTVSESLRRAEKRMIWTNLGKPELGPSHRNNKTLAPVELNGYGQTRKPRGWAGQQRRMEVAAQS